VVGVKEGMEDEKDEDSSETIRKVYIPTPVGNPFHIKYQFKMIEQVIRRCRSCLLTPLLEEQ
jgi:hypothetical protein